MATPQGITAATSLEQVPGIRVRDNWWVLVAVGILVAAIASGSFWLLNFVHVFSGLLWTGTDLFMGFIIGPILRRVDISTRRAILLRLMPRMLFYMPTVSAVATTAGWFMASDFGFLRVPFPDRWWMVAAFVIAAALVIQGLGILLPINLKVYFEMRKERPDGKRVQRLMSYYVRFVAMQGVMQVAIILVMARLATGF